MKKHKYMILTIWLNKGQLFGCHLLPLFEIIDAGSLLTLWNLCWILLCTLKRKLFWMSMHYKDVIKHKWLYPYNFLLWQIIYTAKRFDQTAYIWNKLFSAEIMSSCLLINTYFRNAGYFLLSQSDLVAWP